MARKQTFLDVEWSDDWRESYARLPADRRASCDRAAMELIKGQYSPGLRVKPILPDKYFLEARIAAGERIIFRVRGERIVFVDVVAHDEIGRYGRGPRTTG
ncbi:MAG TPA: hypothetical protein VGB47_03315 [Thermoanaerobaculia bacterium]